MAFASRSKSLRIVALVGVLSTLAVASGIAPAHCQDEVLHLFRGHRDGAQPSGGLIADNKGSLYGGTGGGGTGTQCYDGTMGCGTLYKIAKDGREKVLYSFQGGSDGISPAGSLLTDNSGDLYGATEGGGGNGCAGYGCGTIFKLARGGKETVLYTFQGGSDGGYPQGSLIADTSGNFYGVTGEGGYGAECCGTVFEVQPNGNKITLYTFQGGSDGAYPVGGLIADAAGNLYGMTDIGGGTGCGGDGCGTVFKLTPGGTESVLYAFQGITDGQFPEAGLITDDAGDLYGTTTWGGTSDAGTVFEVTPAGQKTVLYSFKGGSYGGYPEAGLIMDKKGNLYGTTYGGGATGCKKQGFEGCGTAFELTPGGTETVLCRFDQAGGGNPAAPLLSSASHGALFLFGTTYAGGKGNNGAVFELKLSR